MSDVLALANRLCFLTVFILLGCVWAGSPICIVCLLASGPKVSQKVGQFFETLYCAGFGGGGEPLYSLFLKKLLLVTGSGVDWREKFPFSLMEIVPTPIQMQLCSTDNNAAAWHLPKAGCSTWWPICDREKYSCRVSWNAHAGRVSVQSLPLWKISICKQCQLHNLWGPAKWKREAPCMKSMKAFH